MGLRSCFSLNYALANEPDIEFLSLQMPLSPLIQPYFQVDAAQMKDRKERNSGSRLSLVLDKVQGNDNVYGDFNGEDVMAGRITQLTLQ